MYSQNKKKKGKEKKKGKKKERERERERRGEGGGGEGRMVEMRFQFPLFTSAFVPIEFIHMSSGRRA